MNVETGDVIQTVKRELFESAKTDNAEKVREILNHSNSLLSITTGGKKNSIRHMAAKHGSINVIRKIGQDLIKRDEKLFQNKVGHTWLHVAARHGKSEVASFILKEFEDISIKQKSNKHNETFLDVAISSVEFKPEDCTDFVDKLDDKTIEEFVTMNDAGETLLHVIAASGLGKIVRRFNFLPLGQKDEKQDTALHTAVRHNNFETFKTTCCTL